MTLASAYTERVPLLKKVAADLNDLLREILLEVPHVEGTTWRVKAVASFAEKATRKRYTNPLYDIQDQIGLRVVVVYKSDVKPATDKVADEFRQVENRAVEEPEPEAFSYEARHLVCVIPPEIQASHRCPIDFFELQISTVFQHAWAQANHDVGYKSKRDLSYDDKRKVAWAAAPAWGADMIFDELFKSLKD